MEDHDDPDNGNDPDILMEAYFGIEDPARPAWFCVYEIKTIRSKFSYMNVNQKVPDIKKPTSLEMMRQIGV